MQAWRCWASSAVTGRRRTGLWPSCAACTPPPGRRTARPVARPEGPEMTTHGHFGAADEPASPTVVGGRAAYAGDDGAAAAELTAELTAALADWQDAGTPASTARVYAAFAGARVFVPVAARLGDAAPDPVTGLLAEKSSELALVTPVSASGATAVAAFTTPASMAAWRADVRPVPVSGRDTCATAVAEGHAAVVVDLGTTAFVGEC